MPVHSGVPVQLRIVVDRIIDGGIVPSLQAIPKLAARGTGNREGIRPLYAELRRSVVQGTVEGPPWSGLLPG